MTDRWTDRRRAEFVRYREKCQRQERRNTRLMALAIVGSFIASLVYGWAL